MSERFTAIRDALRAGQHVDERAFDAVYPDATRFASNLHWSPIDIAACAARWLVPQPGARILDIGAGAGKFCIVAAAVCNAKITGIEHRAQLVTIAKRAAAAFGVDVDFEHGSFETCDPHRFDGFYLYNPFAENFAGPGERIDDSIDLSAHAFARFSSLAEEFLDRARAGTRVVTYYGFGGTMPLPYQRVTHAYGGRVELWVKTSPRRSKLA